MTLAEFVMTLCMAHLNYQIYPYALRYRDTVVLIEELLNWTTKFKDKMNALLS